jgi:hypothetical protein
MRTGGNAGIAKLDRQSAIPASAGLIDLTSAAVALNRMNRDEFFAKLADHGRFKIVKAGGGWAHEGRAGVACCRGNGAKLR